MNRHTDRVAPWKIIAVSFAIWVALFAAGFWIFLLVID